MIITDRTVSGASVTRGTVLVGLQWTVILLRDLPRVDGPSYRQPVSIPYKYLHVVIINCSFRFLHAELNAKSTTEVKARRVWR